MHKADGTYFSHRPRDFFRIRAGKEAEPFREVTISGDFFEVLHQVRQVGDEVFVTGAAAASVLVPDLMTGELTVSGT